METKKKHTLIIGAGPAGLTAGADLLKTKKFSVEIIEKEAMVGGLARTTEYKNCLFDIGPHHYITSSEKVETWWKSLMKKDFIPHKRFTRIYYKNHFFNYPLEPLNVLRGLSIFECIHCIVSYIKIRLFPIKNVTSFQDWVTNKFGYRLFSIFFKTYTEKVWGIPCTKISADWASQRIKGFSLSKAIFYAFFSRWFKKNAPRTLCDTFYYPSRGSGTLWEKVAKNFKRNKDSSLFLNEEVVSIEHDGKKIQAVCTKQTTPQKENLVQKLKIYPADYFLSTMPLQKLILALDPLPNKTIISAAKALAYRGLITINLIINKENICPDHWLYIHEKMLKMGRIGNMNNFSMKMVDHLEHTALSLEYFEFVNQGLWNKTDKQLIELAKQEMEKTGLVEANQIIDGMVMRIPDAYPVYDENYKQHLDTALNYLKQFSNLQLMGRNGLHRYNNMDIAMISAWEALENILKQEQLTKKAVKTKKNKEVTSPPA